MDSPSSHIDNFGIEGRDNNNAPLIRIGERFRTASTRARSACQVCRWKKVRCDARDGKSCSNCSFDGVQCIMLPKRSRNKSAVTKTTKPPARPASKADSITVESRPSLTRITEKSNRQSEDVPFEPETGSSEPWTPNNLEQAAFLPRSLDRSLQYSALNLTSDPQELPDYIKPLPASLGADDIEYLRKKGAFTLPDPHLRDECLKGYFLNIHPLYPLVDFVKVHSIIHGTNPENEKLSLLLLQALIFAGCAWVDVRLIRHLGFLTRKAFRQSLHKKIRLLYDADYEEDKFCLVQSLVLWSFWWKGSNENKDGWHYLGVAQSVARTVDLHKSISNSNMSPAMQRLRRQVWWALVTRDTVGCFGLSRAPRVKDTDHDVPILRLEDFDLEETTSEMSSPAAMQSGAQKHIFARMCIEHARLVRIFYKILNEACPEGRAGRTAVLVTAQQMEGSNEMSSRGELNIANLKACEDELRKWRQELPEELWHNGPLPFSLSEWEKAELALKGLLSMMFYTALMTLHRPQMLPSASTSSLSSTSERPREDLSRATVRHAAQEITRIGMDFFKADLVASLSASCISCLMPASINHVFDLFSENATIRLEASQRLEQCKSVLEGFSEQQFAPAWVLQTIDQILNRAQQQNSRDNYSRTDRGGRHGTSQPLEDGRGASTQATNRAFDSLTSADHSTPSAISVPITDSLPGATASNIASQLADLSSNFPNSGEQYWSSSSYNQNSTSNEQLPYFLSAQGFSEETSNVGALEEMWLDFVRVSETSAGSGWTNGNF